MELNKIVETSSVSGRHSLVTYESDELKGRLYIDNVRKHMILENLEVREDLRRLGIGTKFIQILRSEYEGYLVSGVSISTESSKFWRNYDKSIPVSDKELLQWIEVDGFFSFQL